MTTDITITGSTTDATLFAGEVDRVAELVADGVAANTRRAYTGDLADFASYCGDRGLAALPADPTTVAAYAAWLVEGRGLKIATARRRLAAIATAHAAAGFDSPTASLLVRTAWRGLTRQHGTGQTAKRAITVAELRAMVEGCGDDLAGLRDRAMLLIGFGAAMRRSELVALRVEDVRVEVEGIRIAIRRSKTDQHGAGEVVAITRGTGSTDAVAALAAWLAASGIADGAIFRRIDRHGRIGDGLTPQSVALVVKSRAAAAGIDPEVVAGHSLRSGLATAAAAAGAEERDIQRQTRHKSTAMVRRYVQAATVFDRNVTRGLL